MPNLSGLKTEISSVRNISKITNAMQLVASAKLRKISKKVIDTHNYVSEVYSLFNDIIRQTDKSVFLKESNFKANKTLWVVINSNLGLCGGYNLNVNKLVLQNLKLEDEIFAIGSKAVSFFRSKKIKIKNQITDIDINFTNKKARSISNDLLDMYINHEFDEIKIVYTKFINNVTFEPAIIRIFPIIKLENNFKHSQSLVFEPDAEQILSSTILIYINAIIYGTIIESQVSEQASRRTAMENATNNGKNLEQTLSLKYNRQRQGAITQEISEIVSGANNKS
ncbi:F0F1 ATP synthase subunit gamma [Mycoplasma capricolum subsp. capripneumoniae]|uniref:ATP synthase F1 subunit gamma n=1 Tax=Mycoplasma capricolum TaxID=2095 RepID=UPI0002F0475D|nr:ATP synthase F1 subunit gamma [Mycoplasma capricolum]AOQ21850.1 F0F1 ATP synthase subunit gamma [Mycoplasma capricolum subsp. capripneumoniae M1601]KEY84361.1 ATP synthase gamma chain [Mycoplasma capricolum subsp. capripneumoniae 99108]QDL19341.1 F0F1 ATP synthase subunit gamma [Mycoplasma capricolum subsp. capripneumoniae]QDL20027.1 F0F1 ATP synthase subunit gamma [Mycoplasma capricolum subsp. capripneumoniae]QDL20713.1 F0F1 ATP synthase subunit gamma [Mycoplasma capricolum subsp. capripne